MNRQTPSAVARVFKIQIHVAPEFLDPQHCVGTWVSLSLFDLVNGALAQPDAMAKFGLAPAEHRPRDTQLRKLDERPAWERSSNG